MIGIIDTSSLLAITRYYLSLKDERDLLDFIESKFRRGDLIFLNTIKSEAFRTQKGIVIESMKFLDEPELCVKDEDLLPPAPRRFSNQLDHNLCVPLQKKRLTDEQYVLQKEAYMQSGDIKMVLYALNNVELDPVIITEETPLNNDGKLFRKLPMVCNFLGIRYMSIVEWLRNNGIHLTWNFSE